MKQLEVPGLNVARFVRVTRLILLAMLLSPGWARADGLAVMWQAPEECGNRAEFEQGVSEIFGARSAKAGAKFSPVGVVIRFAEGAWHVRVTVEMSQGSGGQRDLVAATCREAVAAAEVIVATSLSGSVAESPPGGVEVEAEREPKSAPEAAASPSAPRAPRSEQPRPATSTERRSSTLASHRGASSARGWTPGFGARVGVDPLLFPSFSEIAWLTLGLRYDPYKLELLAAATNRESQQVSGGGGAAEAQLLTAGIVGCRATVIKPIRVFGCVGAELGQFWAAGRGGLLNQRTTSKLWSAGLVQGEVSWDVSRTFAFNVGAQGIFAFREMDVRLQPSLSVYRTGRFDARPWLGFELLFR